MTLSNDDMGFEKSFLESWEDFALADNFDLIFMDCDFRSDVFDQDIIDNCRDMQVSLDQGFIAVYHKEDEEGVPYKYFKFNMVLEK